MYRIILFLLTLTLLPLPVTAEAPVSFADDLTGFYTWPEGSSVDEASYVYRSTYPQLAGDSALALTFNNVFAYEASDALGFECPMIASGHSAADGQMQVDVTYAITHLSADYLSVRVDKTVMVGEDSSHFIKAYNFALTGDEASSMTSLPYLLELVEDGDTDDWYVDRQTAKADACIREMVWVQIEQAMKAEGSQIWPDLTFEELEWSFYPEEDFFLNEAGQLVFFLQENVIAPPEAGQFLFPLSLDDILDEI